jgi:hypothetical protein
LIKCHTKDSSPSYGISDQITMWITSFLANRTQTVLLENTTSEKIAVTSGGLLVVLCNLLVF